MKCPWCKENITGMTGLQELNQMREHIKQHGRVFSVQELAEMRAEEFEEEPSFI